MLRRKDSVDHGEEDRAVAVPDEERGTRAEGDGLRSAAEDAAATGDEVELVAVVGALGVLAAAAVFAGPLSAYLESTSEQLFDRAGYVSAVLGNEEEG